MYVHVHVRTVCMYVCTYVHTYIRTYVYKNKQSFTECHLYRVSCIAGYVQYVLHSHPLCTNFHTHGHLLHSPCSPLRCSYPFCVTCVQQCSPGMRTVVTSAHPYKLSLNCWKSKLSHQTIVQQALGLFVS